MSEKRKRNVNVQMGLPIILENLERLAIHQKKDDTVLSQRMQVVVALLKGLDDDNLWSSLKFRLRSNKK